MGKQKYLIKINELFDKSPVVSFDSIQRITREKKQTNYAKLLVNNLIKNGMIRKVTKGVYTKHDETSLAVFCFKPAYLGLQTSLSYHNLWEQETIPVILTTRKVRSGIRNVMGNNVLIRRIDKKYLFGFETVSEGRFYFPYSDVEKTLIDLVYFNEKISKEVLKEIKTNADRKKLNNYLKSYTKIMKKRVLDLIE